jgi:hypothetical protein
MPTLVPPQECGHRPVNLAGSESEAFGGQRIETHVDLQDEHLRLDLKIVYTFDLFDHVADRTVPERSFQNFLEAGQ